MTRTRKAAAAAVTALSLALALTACGGEDGSGKSGDKKAKAGAPQLSVSGAYLPQPAMSDMAAGFLTVRNTGGAADELTSVTTPLSDDVTLHATEGTAMRHVATMKVPAGGRLTLASGGSHLMLGKLSHKPKVGEKVRFTLHFATSGPVEVDVPVKPATYRPKA
ncbi:copper chaperone PCu(A)C [Streptomyces sp. XD-27]|uniref:copper chaperone PCu(A)C n=1 Tax=Streptomyces sp. XD-27 TaxID=3062779 RepID=UPI0026F44F10|nr:copper chaperone PCu(A)C [Streptomyces sp. XD-27]WKX71635.1 copper chaperone PCu(A)C [Streptomyces sp. XD-27]